ncbi:MAG: hypothetical protein U9N73_13065 [Candidatus Auribacterota bacterium]|nr:hypothetical protein [Candidatus Auribacterota bacterium]
MNEVRAHMEQFNEAVSAFEKSVQAARVRVRIFTAERKHAVIVPRTALFRGAG